MEFASNGKGNLGVTLGAIGTGLNLLGNNGLGGILGGGWNGGCCGQGYGQGYGCNGGDRFVNRYEMGLEQKISEQDAHIRLLESNIYTDQKLAALNDRYERRFAHIESEIAHQAVHNATSDGMLGCLAQQVNALQGLTKTIIPKESICPEYMQRYNSWVAPTTTAPDTGA